MHEAIKRPAGGVPSTMIPHRSTSGLRDARNHRTDTPTVFIVDGDDGARVLLGQLLSPSYVIRAFGSLPEFFAAHDPLAAGCIILDHAAAGDELMVQAKLAENDCLQPVILLSACATVPMTVSALRAGAFNVLSKPLRPADLMDAVREALRVEASTRRSRDAAQAAQRRLAALTPREREVLASLVGGKLNKQIAAQLGIVENTVKAHRARIMQKLGVRGLAELVFFTTTHQSRPDASEPPRTRAKA
jgi:FixJ family two-component response regulator